MSDPTLGPAPAAALAAVRAHAKRRRGDDLRRIEQALGSSSGDAHARLTRQLRAASVTVNFHPDRVLGDGSTVIEALLRDRIYRSQFETGVSNGGLTAFAGGDRDRWEARLFASAYQQPGVPASDRPKYGGLNLLAHRDGACPRFGSCHLRLKPSAWSIATITYGDSVLDPQDRGTADALDGIVAAIVEAVRAGSIVLGRRFDRIDELLGAPSIRSNGRALDHYLEAQLHGPLPLDDYVAGVVMDPAFVGTPAGLHLAELAHTLGVPLEHHDGFTLPVDAVPAEMRGPKIPQLAARLARSGRDMVDAAVIGAAAASVVRTPIIWQDWGPPAEALQHLKYLWHVLVVHGRPRPR